ncbi:MAG: hydroxyethylthiazole kinase [Candidatus Latescibacterota bacterium]
MSEILDRVRQEKPLVHHITNWVTIYDCANMTRAFGALPVMAHAPEEAADMAGIASALVLNIGTLTTELVESMIIAARSANRKGIPVVLDAVGVGATRLRDLKAAEILNTVRVDVIKGNASEIARLAGENVITRGVESSEVEADLIAVAKKLARERSATVVITGKEDVIADNKQVFLVKNGHALMGSIVGTGCMAASVIGAFAAVEPNHARAAAAALACYGVAGEIAAAQSKGPGSFRENFYDAVYNLAGKTVEMMGRVEER